MTEEHDGPFWYRSHRLYLSWVQRGRRRAESPTDPKDPTKLWATARKATKRENFVLGAREMPRTRDQDPRTCIKSSCWAMNL